MRDVGVVTGEEADWLWEFDGTPDDYRRLMAALSVISDDEAPAD